MSIKAMLQFLLKTDPLLTKLSSGTGREIPGPAEMYKNSGASNTLIIGLLPAAAETADNINFLLDQLPIEDLMKSMPAAKLCVCADLKMLLVLLGQKSAGARYSCPFCFFSRWSNHSHDEQRTFASITADNEAAQAALAAGMKLRPGDFHSSLGD